MLSGTRNLLMHEINSETVSRVFEVNMNTGWNLLKIPDCIDSSL
jgi:hypothetical protein